MKNILINNPAVVRNTERSQAIQSLLEEEFHKYSLHIDGFELFSDLNEKLSVEQEIILETVVQYVKWVHNYFVMILHKNQAALEKKTEAYSTFTSITLDTSGRKGKFYFYLDGEIFGLVVGSSYTNITSIIKASFPVFSKMDMDIEVKLFSLSEPEKLF